MVMRSAVGVLLCIAMLALAACGKSPDELLGEARALQEKGDRSAAILQVKSLLQEHPEHTPSRLLLGQLYNDAADYPSAEKEFRHALDGQADPVKVLPALAKALLMQGEAKKVLTEIQPDKVSDRDAVAKILAARGMAHLILRQSQDARKAFDDALAVKPGAPEALVGHARILASERKFDEALAEVAKALKNDSTDADALMLQGDLLRASGKLEEAEQSYKTLVAAHAEHVNGLLALVSMSISRNRLDEAAEYIATVRKASPRNPMVSYFQALIAFRKNDFKTARDSIGAVLKVASNHLPSVLLGGAVEFALGSHELAQTRLKYVLERSPGNLYARRVLAASYTRAGQTQKALETLEPALKAGVKDAAILALAGEVYMQMNDFDRAKAYFEQASALDPKNARMRTGLGLSRLAAGDVDAATADLENASHLDTNRHQADVLLVSAHLQRKQFDNALKAAQSLISKQPDSPVGHNLLAAAYLGKQDVQAARASLVKALEVQPGYVPAATNLAQLDLRKGDPQAARKWLEDICNRDKSNMQACIALATMGPQLGAKPEEIRHWLETTRKHNPDAVQPVAMLSRLHLSEKNPKKAIELVDNALATAPNDVAMLQLAGQVLLAAGETNRAVSTLAKLASAQPDVAQHWVSLAVAQLASNDSSAASSSLRKALSMRPDSREAKALLAESTARQGDMREAAALARELQKQHAKSPLGWVVEGDILMRDRKYSAAAKAYERAFELEASAATVFKLHAALVQDGRRAAGDDALTAWLKSRPEDLAARAYLAESLMQGMSFKRAADQYETILKKQPKQVVALNNLAWCYLQLKDARAVVTAEQAYKLMSDNPSIMDTYGWILVQSGQVQKGAELIASALDRAPKTPEIRFHHAQALNALGNTAKARAEIERLLVESPNFSESAAATRLLQELRSKGS